MQRQAKQTGFTLIELLVVVVIIGILATVALPNLLGAQDKAKNSGVQANGHNVQVALERYGVDTMGKFPTTAEGLEQIMKDNYLNGNQYPPTPWGKRQAAAGNIAADPTHVALGKGAVTRYGSGGDGKAAFDATPALITYGAVAYYNEGSANERYNLVASGKRNSDSICVFHFKNY